MNYQKEQLIDVLYSKFIESAKFFHQNGFSKNVDFTNNFEVDKLKDSFGKLFKEDVENVTQVINPFNHRTLINMLKASFTKNTHKNTLNTVSNYLGYADFDDFASDEHVIVASTNLPKSNPIKSNWLNKRKLSCIFGILVFAMGSFLYYFIQRRQLLDTILSANKYQFAAFKNLPNFKTNSLTTTYDKNGNAYKVIINILNKQAQMGRTVGQPADNPSYYSIQEFTKVDFHYDFTRAKVYTKEHWFLKWYNVKTGKYELKYDVSNEQFYLLQKTQGRWYIYDNDYAGEASKIE